MKLNLSHALLQIRRGCPAYAAVLEDLEQHLRELIRGEHSLQEFAEHYCLPVPPKNQGEDREIILALFHPRTGHADGCLFKDNPNLPCQCGFSEVVGRYRWALQRAKEIAAAHHGSSYDAQGPSEEDEPTPTTGLDALAAALVILARCNIPPDVQELLVRGDPGRGIAPGTLGKALAAARSQSLNTMATEVMDRNQRIAEKDVGIESLRTLLSRCIPALERNHERSADRTTLALLQEVRKAAMPALAGACERPTEEPGNA